MATSPYRAPVHTIERKLCAEAHGCRDIAGVAMLVWLVALARVGVALLGSELPSRELDIAWLAAFLAPVVIAKELASWRRSAAPASAGG